MSFEVRFKLGINLDFFWIQQSVISQFILTILVYVIMIWALMTSFKISYWLHENVQWVTCTIHTLHLLAKDIISASSQTEARTGKSKGSLQETTPKCSLKWIPAHSETRWDKDTFYPSKTRYSNLILSWLHGAKSYFVSFTAVELPVHRPFPFLCCPPPFFVLFHSLFKVSL